MIIPINEKYRISTDTNNYRIDVKIKKNKDGREWQSIKFFSTLNATINRLAEMMLMESNVIGLDNALEEAKRISGELISTLTPKFKVVSEE